MTDAFVSYSHLDREFAVQLNSALTNAGKTIWIDEADIPSGSRWAEDLRMAIEDADTFVFVISPDSVAEGRYSLTELTFARSKWNSPNGRVLPIMLLRTVTVH